MLLRKEEKEKKEKKWRRESEREIEREGGRGV